MPNLNWRDLSLSKQELTPAQAHRGKALLRLGVAARELEELTRELEELFSSPTPLELRVDLPQKWIVFFKTRESESRLLLAHPQQSEWVTTVALEKDHGIRLTQALRGLEAGQETAVGQIISVGPVSNVEVFIQRVA